MFCCHGRDLHPQNPVSVDFFAGADHSARAAVSYLAASLAFEDTNWRMVSLFELTDLFDLNIRLSKSSNFSKYQIEDSFRHLIFVFKDRNQHEIITKRVASYNIFRVTEYPDCAGRDLYLLWIELRPKAEVERYPPGSHSTKRLSSVTRGLREFSYLQKSFYLRTYKSHPAADQNSLRRWADLDIQKF